MPLRGESWSWRSFALGFGGGVATALLLDPGRGAARRALLRDKALAVARRTASAVVRRGKDVGQRMRGRVYEATHRGEAVPDAVLIERVRAQIGRPVSHARAISVRCERGCVVLSGPILSGEVEALIDIVSKVRGVKAIESELDVFENAESVPDPQPRMRH